MEASKAIGLKLVVTAKTNSFCEFDVVVPAHFIDTLYQETSQYQQSTIRAYGFQQGNIPLEYITSHYRTTLLQHIKEFILNYFVINFLYQELQRRKIAISCEPRLMNITLAPGADGIFQFSCNIADIATLRSWRHYPFKPPQRKNYRDLDRQVEAFIKQEHELSITHAQDPIGVGDWVCFSLAVMNATNQCLLFNPYKEYAWIKLGNEEADTPFVELFAGKRIGEHFISSHQCLQEYFSNQIDTNYLFYVEIIEVIPHTYVSLRHIKQAFKLRTNKDLHKKIIEVFSYRNDISQRRETVQATFNTLLARNPFEAPAHLILRRKQALLDTIRENPDYLVYKTMPHFDSTLEKLAEKEVKEMIIIDHLALKEHIVVNHEDMVNYLNLFKRSRTKEFIYFSLPNTKLNGREMPISASALKRYCLREKTLNFAIHHLTKS